MDTPTLKTMILDEIEKCDRPVSPKRMRTLLLANQHRHAGGSTVGIYLSQLHRDGLIKRVWAGGYAKLSWRPPVDDNKEYLREWLRQWFLEHPRTGFTRKQISAGHEEAWGVPVDPGLLSIYLRQLEDAGVVMQSRNVWLLAPGADPFE